MRISKRNRNRALRIQPFCVLVILSFLCPHTAFSEAQEAITATQITEQNASALLSNSLDRSGGVGDWYLANGRIWAIIDDVHNQNLVSPAGGSLIDLGLVETGAEQFVQMLQLINMNRDIVIPYDTIEIERRDDWAAVKVSTSKGLRPEQDGFGVPDETTAKKIHVQTEYRLNANEQFLHVRTVIKNESPQKVRIFNVADILYWGDDTIKPFAGSQNRLGSSRGAPRGFQHPNIDTSSFVSLLRGLGGYTYIAGGGVEGLSPISYGLCSPAEYKKSGLLWGVNDRMVSAIGVFTGDFNSTFDYWKIPFFGIEPEKEFTYERLLVVGERNDVASATDQILPLLAKANGLTGVTGKTNPGDAPVSILVVGTKDNVPITQIRPNHDGPDAGSFKAILPPGDYVAEAHALNRDAQPQTPPLEPLQKAFSIQQAGFTDIGKIQLPPQAALLVEVKERGRPSPARVIIHGINGTPDPEMGSDLLPFTVGGKSTPSSYAANWLLLSGKESAPIRVGLRPGQYEIIATHGFEYSVDRKEVVLDSDNEIPVTLNLSRVIETPGMMTGDFHVHSGASMDSAMNHEQRVLSFVADGVELLIATDHDMLTDYAPTISALDLSDRITSIVGVESTSMLMLSSTPFTIGHYNAFPLLFKPLLPKNGMTLDEGLRPRELYERLRTIGDGEVLIQVNHGRGREPDGGTSFFHALGTEFGKPLSYDSSRPMGEFPNNLLLQKTPGGVRDIDFDAMELLNGTAYDEYLLLRNDWFSLLNQGFNKAATANTDTHIAAQVAGYPRNYILLDDATAERADKRSIIHQIRNQRLFGSTGPLITFTVNKKARPGDLLTPVINMVNLNITVSAAPWIPLDEIRIYANGKQVRQYPAEKATDIVRFQRDVPLAFARDTWVVVEASAKNKDATPILQPPGGLYNIIAPGFAPLAFTNPIFIDIDGNGHFNPPGIPPTPASFAPTWSIKASFVIAFFAVISVARRLKWRRIRLQAQRRRV